MDNYGAAMAGQVGNAKQYAGPALVEQSTEMGSLSAVLGENRARLRNMLELIEERLDRFSPRPMPINATKAETPPEPMPGTLASLRCMAETTGQELNRLDAICTRLRELL